jgi:hypothetical protein
MTIYAYDGNNNYNGVTNSTGKAILNVNTIINLKILAADLNGRHSIEPYLVNTSQAVYRIQMSSAYPQTQQQVASMIDKIVKVFNTYIDHTTLSDISSGIRSGKMPIGSTTTMLGIPGIFSISPIPTGDKDGKTVFEVTGSLARPLYNFGKCASGLGCEYKLGTM